MRDDDRTAAGRHGAGAGVAHPAQLAVGVVGAGRAGTAMAAALARAGHRVVAASAVSQDSLNRIRRSLPGAQVGRPEEVVEAAGLVLLTVPDDVLPGLVSGLAATGVPLAGAAGARERAARAGGTRRPPARGHCRWPCIRS